MNENFSEMLSALSVEDVEFLIVGGYALAVHGYVRATGDLDIWVRPTADNSKRVWRALRRFRAPLSRLQPEDFQDPDAVFQMGIPPNRIDVLTDIAGVAFEEAWQHRKMHVVEGTVVPVLSRDDLVRNKRAVGRPKDVADVAWLESHPAD